MTPQTGRLGDAYTRRLGADAWRDLSKRDGNRACQFVCMAARYTGTGLLASAFEPAADVPLSFAHLTLRSADGRICIRIAYGGVR